MIRTSYRLVEIERIDAKVKQRIVLNRGRHFEVPQAQWGLLANRIADLLSAKQRFFPLALCSQGESEAQSFEPIAVDMLELLRPRRAGVEHLALHAISQLRLEDKLRELGFNRHQLAAALGTIVAHMAHPFSKLTTLQMMTIKIMIKSFKHKGLRQFFESGNCASIIAARQTKLIPILDRHEIYKIYKKLFLII